MGSGPNGPAFGEPCSRKMRPAEQRCSGSQERRLVPSVPSAFTGRARRVEGASNEGDRDVDVPARCLGIGAGLMRTFHKRLRDIPL